MAKSQDKMAEDSKRQREQRGPDRKAEILDKKIKLAGRWWRTPLIPELRRQRQADLCEFEASLLYKS